MKFSLVEMLYNNFASVASVKPNIRSLAQRNLHLKTQKIQFPAKPVQNLPGLSPQFVHDGSVWGLPFLDTFTAMRIFCGTQFSGLEKK